jgi:hypothetical protein
MPARMTNAICRGVGDIGRQRRFDQMLLSAPASAKETQMSPIDILEPPVLGDDSEDDFGAWSLDELHDLADGHSLLAPAMHDGDD